MKAMVMVLALLMLTTTSGARASSNSGSGNTSPKNVYAGPLNATPNFQDCFITNISNNNITVTIVQLDETGAVVEGPVGPQAVAPGSTLSLEATTPSTGPRICKFTAPGSCGKFRASTCVSSDDRCDGGALQAVCNSNGDGSH